MSPSSPSRPPPHESHNDFPSNLPRSAPTRNPDDAPCCPNTGRNLVVCIDGTANQFSEKNTNVVELYSRLLKDETQLVYYNSGIGTYVKPSRISLKFWKQLINHTIDMAIAWNFERIVLGAYLWLSENYQPGDRIFLFGFSRGAYQVRVIAGMIEKVGLLHKGNNEQIGFAYELYTAVTKDSKRGNTTAHDKAESNAERLCIAFKKALARADVKVHFVGAWDTVSSIGVTRGPSLPETVTGMIHVCHFRHALALDERRVKFLPEYANGGTGPDVAEKGGDVKEVWFAGSHSDIGGGNILNMRLDQFGPALRWMTYEAIKHGLHIQPYHGEWNSITPTNSLTPIWKAFEFLPFRRLSYKGKDRTTHRPHLGKARVIQANQHIHGSVFEAMSSSGYCPSAQMADGNAVTIDDAEVLKEGDRYASAGDLLHSLKDRSEGALTAHVDALTVQSSFSFQPLTEQPDALDTIVAVLTWHANVKTKEQSDKLHHDRQNLVALLVTALSTFLTTSHHKNQYPSSKFQALKSGIKLGYPSHYDAVMEVINHLSLRQFDNHTRWIRSVRFHPDGNQILSADESGWSIWDADTGRVDVEKSYNGPSSAVDCAAFSPDGSRIAVGFKGGSVWIWDIRGNNSPAKLEGHVSWVISIAFSYDGQRLATCYSDCTVLISLLVGDKTTPQLLVRISTHRRWFSVAFSPDGSLIAAGDRDGIIDIWDTSTGGFLRELQGHDKHVKSISFSPDGSRIASGSFDHTVLVWNVSGAGDLPLTLRGHTDRVHAVAWSPDGRYIASGADDRMMRLWDLKTGEALMVYEAGNWVTSVAFSPDGSHLASGTYRGPIHIRSTELPQSSSAEVGR